MLTAGSSLSALSSILSGSSSPWIIRDEQWPEICELAIQQGVGPYLLWVLSQKHVDTTSGTPWIDRLKAESRLVAIEQIKLEIAQSEVNAEFQASGISAIWLKGFPLSRTVYPESFLRPMGDLDVLVPYSQRQRALDIAAGLGYAEREQRLAVRKRDEGLLAQLAHHYHLHSPSHGVILEIHFQFAKSLLSLEQMDWFYAQTSPLDADDCLISLNPEAHLLYLCAHAALQHGETDFRLLRYLDLHLLISKSALNWNEIVSQAIVLGWGYAVERSLNLAVRLFSTPIPDSVLRQLSSQRLAHDAVAFALDLQGPGARWGKVRKQLSLLPLSERVRLIRLIAFPSRRYMRAHYADKPVPFEALYYLYRWFDQGRDVCFWTLSRMRMRNHKNELTQ